MMDYCAERKNYWLNKHEKDTERSKNKTYI